MGTYADRQTLIVSMNSYLRDKITANDLDQVYAALHTILPKYDVVKRTDISETEATNNDYITRFVDAKLAEGRCRSTTNRYWYILNQFFNTENVTTMEVTTDHIRDFLARESDRGIANTTLNGYRDVLNAYFGWMSNEGIILRNPCANVGTLKAEKKMRESFTNVDIQRLLNACGNKRDHAIILFLLNTGCRISEMCGLRMKDLNVDFKECIVFGKGRKYRKIYFDDVTAWALEEYLCDSPAHPNEAVFRGKRSNGLTPGGVRAMLNTVAKKANVTKVFPHRFRHTFATSAVNKQMPIQEVKALLGHSKIETTMLYVHQNDERTKRAYEYFLG